MDFAAIARNEEVTTQDVESTKLALKQAYGVKIKGIVDEAEAHQVTDIDSEKQAVEMAGQASTLLKALEKQRKDVIGDADTFVRDVNKFCKGFKDSIELAVRTLKKKIGDFQWKKELERRKQEEVARKAAEKLKKQVEKEAKKAGVEPPPIDVVAPVIKKETVTRSESGATAHIRTEWKMTEIVDFAKVPNQYKELNTKAINAAIKSGIRNIAGLKIEEVASTVLRT